MDGKLIYTQTLSNIRKEDDTEMGQKKTPP